MSFRRFVYLVTDDVSRRFYLRRIDMSRFFLPKAQRERVTLLTDPPQLEEAELPHPAMRFIPPFSELCKGSLQFMLLAGSRDDDDKVVATDQTGRTLLYDGQSDCVRTLCNLTGRKSAPISMTVGKNLYILDQDFHPMYSRDQCFDGLVYDGDGSISRHHDGYCHSLPPPPYTGSYDPTREEDDPAHFTSYALVGGSNIWISKNSLGTHSFDVASGLWTKVGDWALPLYGHAQYVKELNLWLGLTCGYGEESSVCAVDLNVTLTPPEAICVRWWDSTPPEWISKASHLVHLGGSRFCHARFIETRQPGDGCRKFLVLAGIEVERRHGELLVLKHRSEGYSINYRILQWEL